MLRRLEQQQQMSSLVSDCQDQRKQCSPGSHSCFMMKTPPPSERWKKGGAFVGECIVDDMTRIGRQQNLGGFRLLAFDNRYLRFSAWFRQISIEQLQVSFVQCSSESLFLSADLLVEKCCV